MADDVEIAGQVSSWPGGAVFKGVGDKDIETHFTKDKEGWHLTTNLSENILGGEGSAKGKFDQQNIGG